MARNIKFPAKRTAERVLSDVLHRRNWTVDTRDALADEMERVVINAFQDAGMAVVNKSED